MVIERLRKYNYLCISLVPCFAALISGQAVGRQLEEVVVTATKREAGMQDIPIAITALSGDFLEQKNILSATDLEKFTPGLRIPQQDASRTFVHIRGVGNGKFDIGSEGSVGIFVDEIYVPRFSGADLGFLDVDRVEVLKGPKGTLLGRNTAAGAINVSNRRPTHDTEGFLEAGLGNEDSYLLRGALSGPVSETVNMRLSLGAVEDGGMQENTFSGTTNDMETFASRVQASWEASDTLSVHAGLNYTEREQSALLQKNTATGDDGIITPLFAAPGVTYTVNDNLRKYPMDEDGNYKGTSLQSNLRIEKNISDLSIISISGYQHTDDEIFEDFDASPYDIGVSGTDTESDTYSQEFRVTADNFLAGIYFYNDSATSDGTFAWGDDSLQFFLSGRSDVFDRGIVDVDTTSWAVFGEYTLDLSNTFSLTLGGRYSYDEKEFEFDAQTNLPGLPAVLVPFNYAGDENWDSFDPKIALTWAPEDDFLVYLSYNEGYKSGGVQFTAINEAVARQLFDPEELSAYEMGIKTELLEKTLRLNASAFYYEYDNLQVQRVDTAISDGVPVAFTDNAARSEINGAEVELFWLLPRGFSTRLAYAYLDATYDDYAGTAGEDFSGNPLPVSPKHTIMFSLDYRHSLKNDWQLFAGTDWTWVDDHNFDVDDDDLATKQSAYALGAVTIALSPPGGNWNVSAFVQNLTDKEYYAQKTRRLSEIIASTADGRRYGVRLKYTF